MDAVRQLSKCGGTCQCLVRACQECVSKWCVKSDVGMSLSCWGVHMSVPYQMSGCG